MYCLTDYRKKVLSGNQNKKNTEGTQLLSYNDEYIEFIESSLKSVDLDQEMDNTLSLDN